MEIFMRNISTNHNKHDVTRAIARELHMRLATSVPTNFAILLFKDSTKTLPHRGMGILTLPSLDIGERFLRYFGGQHPSGLIYVGKLAIIFSQGRNKAKPDIVETILRQPYMDPADLEKEDKIDNDLRRLRIGLTTIHFGRDCRDKIFSSEWRLTLPAVSGVSLDRSRREIVVHIGQSHRIAVLFSQTKSVTTNSDQKVIHLRLYAPPSFEKETGEGGKRRRLSSLPFDDDFHVPHQNVAPFTSVALRLVCSSSQGLASFRKACTLCGIETREELLHVERRKLYNAVYLAHLDTFVSELEKSAYEVGFQIEVLLKSLALDARELCSLTALVTEMLKLKGPRYTAGMLRYYAMRLVHLREEEGKSRSDYVDCFRNSRNEYADQQRRPGLPVEDGSFECLHVCVTPSSAVPDGPFPERSSRVIRRFLEFQQHFIRVSFVDENRCRFRFDREVDGVAFAEDTFGAVLKGGLTIAGRRFEFLAYSQSALKEHTVWFCAPFYDPDNGGHVNAARIRDSLGHFDDELKRCPARYAARLSQAFTATDASITVEVEEVFMAKDIKASGNYLHTDGNGTMSREVASAIWKKLRGGKRRSRKNMPAAFQVRFMGSKGMLHIDHTLSGRQVVLRESMVKFDAPDSLDIEIARAFGRPGRYYLNRPLIAVLEARGVSRNVFQKYQDDAVAATHNAARGMEEAANLLDWYGLGISYRLPSIMQKLKKIGVKSLRHDDFYEKTIQYSVNHILRELKHKARILIPGGYTLVGVADVHGYLQEGEIFVCIQPEDQGADARFYLEGDVLISRSPTSHPGDVQVVRAIGRPPEDSPFAIEPLPNCVVFATKGERPLPSCLGGGDLDGDEYNLIPLDTLPEFRPRMPSRPGAYEPSQKRLIDHPATIDDIADFVVDYINSDVVGLVATQWLIISDQSEDNIFDVDCLVLSKLNSYAVDYPKCGSPVSQDDIPKLKFKTLPDWRAPETLPKGASGYYKSKRAIGHLFRAIDLPAVKIQSKAARQLQKDLERQENEDASSVSTLDELEELLSSVDLEGDPVYSRVIGHINLYIDTAYASQNREEDTTEEIAGIFHRYATELQHICTTHCLSHSGGNILTEEEAVAGTIVARTAQFRRRSETISKLREQTDWLVKRIRYEIIGEDEDMLYYDSLERAYWALEFAFAQDSESRFGSKSFAWITLGAIFELTRLIDEEMKNGSVGGT